MSTQTQPNYSDETKAVYALIWFLLCPIAIFYEPYVITIIWKWLIFPGLHWQLPYFTAIGLNFILNLFISTNNSIARKDWTIVEYVKVLFENSIINPTVVLFFGYCVSLIMAKIGA